MTDISADILNAALGPTAIGPDGMGIRATPQGATIDGDKVKVDMAVDPNSLAQARGHIEHKNKDVAKTIPEPKAHTSRKNAAEEQYGGMFAKAGLSALAQKALVNSPVMGMGRNPYHRLRSTQGMPQSKNMLLQLKQRQLLKLRKTFDEISARPKHQQAMSIESAPEPIKKQVAEKIIASGVKMVAGAPATKVLKSVAKASNMAGFDKWEHALAPGSYASTPRPRAS